MLCRPASQTNQIEHIAGWALYAIVLSIGKQRILTFRGAETPGPISIKLEVYDFVRDPSPHDKFGGVALRGWSGQIGDLSL